jgi:hypothetical protein
MTDETPAAEAVEGAESTETPEAAPAVEGDDHRERRADVVSLEERVASLEEHVAAALAGAAGAAEIGAQLATHIEETRGWIDQLVVRVEELAGVVSEGTAMELLGAEEPSLEELAERDRAEPIEGDACRVCGAKLTRAAMDEGGEDEPIRCQRCGAAHG